MPDRAHILIVGGGYVGMYTALRLQKKLRRNEARITVVDPQNYMTYQPFLPETAAGSLEPRHVVVPLRKVLKHCRVVTGLVTSIDHANRTATVQSGTVLDALRRAYRRLNGPSAACRVCAACCSASTSTRTTASACCRAIWAPGPSSVAARCLANWTC